MTREEAWKNAKGYLYDALSGEEADEIIKALEQEPCDKCVYSTKDGYCQYDDITETIPPFEPCEDAISRQMVLSMQYRIDDSTTLSTRNVVNVDDIEDLPPVTPQQKTGHWIRKATEIENDGIRITYECSECGVDQLFEEHYCPNCGVKMEVGE